MFFGGFCRCVGQIAIELPHTSNNSFFCGCQSQYHFHLPATLPDTLNIHHYHRSFTNFWAARYQTRFLRPKHQSKFAEAAFTGNTHCRGKLFQLCWAVCFSGSPLFTAGGAARCLLGNFTAGGSARCLPGSFAAGGSISNFLYESSTFLALQAVSQAAVGLSLT